MQHGFSTVSIASDRWGKNHQIRNFQFHFFRFGIIFVTRFKFYQIISCAVQTRNLDLILINALRNDLENLQE